MRIKDFDTPVMDKVYDIEVALDERYVGETPAVKHVFELFCKFRDKYRDKLWATASKKSFSIAGDPDAKAFCDACAELWGCESVSMVIQQAAYPQSMTTGIMYREDLPKNRESLVEYGPNGVRFKTKYHVHILVISFTGLLLNFDYTNREVFAIFLHEIGHNFQEATNGVMNALSDINTYVAYLYTFYLLMMEPKVGLKEVFSMLWQNNGPLGIINGAYNSIVSTKAGRLLVNTVGILGGFIEDAKMFFKKTTDHFIKIEGLKGIIRSGLMQLLFPTMFVRNYKGEQMADSFAADLGFGPDLASGFMKNTKKGMEVDYLISVPILNAILDLWSIPFTLATYAFNEHPMDGVRVRDIHDTMKADLNRGYFDPKAKKALEKDIAAIEKNMANFQSEMLKHPLEYNQIFSSAVLCIMYNTGGGIKYAALKGDKSEEKQQALERNKNQATGNIIKI